MADGKKKKVKMGRPEITDPELRIDRRVPIMLRPSEAQLIRVRATKEGLTVSAWSRKVLVEAAGGSIE